MSITDDHLNLIKKIIIEELNNSYYHALILRKNKYKN